MAKSPLFNFRLPEVDQQKVATMARVYGAATPSAFVREMVVAMCSEDVAQAHAFIGRLMERITGQMTLEFQQRALEEARNAAKGHPRVKRRTKPKGGRRGRT